MTKYAIYTGENLTQKMYLETWKLDNVTFDKKDLITKKTALEWFEYSNRSTIVLWNETKNELVGYITPYLISHKFASSYIINDVTYKEGLKKSVFCKPKKGAIADIYLFSTVVVPKYRDIALKGVEKTSSMFNKTAFGVLNEALLEWVCDIKIKGVSINYVFGETVNADGEKYLKSLGLQPCFALQDDNKYAKLFSPYMFSKCSNQNKILELYDDAKMRTKFDKSILNNHEYLTIKDNVLHYKGINLLALVKKYKAPLEVAYTPIIEEQIINLKTWFKDEIKAQGYTGKYNYAYATKANYYSEVVTTALNQVDMLETSSAYDINLMLELAKLGYIKKGFTIICNGFKNERYVDNLTKLLDMGINVIPVIENTREFELLSKLKGYKFNVGLRYNSDFESRLIKNDFHTGEEFDNRFGFNAENIFKMAEKINEIKFMKLQVLHFHFGGSINNIDNYIKGFSNILDLYCKLKKEYPTMKYFDFGGGLPIKYSLTYSFNYKELVKKMIATSKAVCATNGVEEPDLIGEHGRFTSGDHGFYIYKIDFTKKTYENHWYIINSSLMNMAPDMWGIQQDFTILPVNLYENDCIPVCLGGETCDPDDRYFLKEKNVKMFMPEIKEGQTLYIAIFSVGAYQEIISGIGGIHHCLIPEGNELIIYEEKGKLQYYPITKASDNKKAIKVLDYNTKHMDKFFRKKK